jgi:predicted DNA-binding transcriptional regulator YafY
MRWDDIKRFQVIEALLLWEGRLNARQLMDYFDTSRPTAQKYITEYKHINTDCFEFNSHERAHIAKNDFKPKFINQDFAKYHELFAEIAGSSMPLLVESLPPIHRNISPSLVRPLLQAIRYQQRLDIGYISLSSPEYEDRIIQPHSLVHDGTRYHVRAYCEKNQDYRDFVLSRFSGEYNFEGDAQFDKAKDTLWQTEVELKMCPDHRLNDLQKKVIANDYQMQDQMLIIKVRAALLKYLLQHLRLDIYQGAAEQQQIVIEPQCRKEIEKYIT